MKNLKMFAISLAAFAAMTMGVQATSNHSGANCTASCKAEINGTFKYLTFADALKDAENGDTITLTADDTLSSLASIQGNSGDPIKKTLTINVAAYTLSFNTPLYVGEGGALTITGAKKGNFTAGVSSQPEVINVLDGGSLTIKGSLTVENTINGLVNVNNGTVTVEGGNVVLKAPSSKNIIAVGANGATVSLNAKVGEENTRFAGTLVNTSAVTDKKTTVTFEGGAYYTSTPIVSMAGTSEGLSVVVNNGTYDTTAGAFVVAGGSLKIANGNITASGITVLISGGNVTIGGGTIKTTGNVASVQTYNAGEGKLTITNGVISTTKNSIYSPLYLQNGTMTYDIQNGEFAAGKSNVPAVYIEDALLTGLEEDGTADHFKGILSGGKYLYSIIGGATVDGDRYSAETVQNYVVAAGATVAEEGNYKVINPKPQDTQEPTVGDGDANDQKPAEDVPNVPKTGDNILVYASLGLISAVSVGFTAKRKENN